MLYNINVVSCGFFMAFFRLKSCDKAKKCVHSSVKTRKYKTKLTDLLIKNFYHEKKTTLLFVVMGTMCFYDGGKCSGG